MKKTRNKKVLITINRDKDLQNYFSELKLGSEYHPANSQEKIELINLLFGLEKLNKLHMSDGCKICFFKDILPSGESSVPFKIKDAIKRLSDCLEPVIKGDTERQLIATSLVKEMFNESRSSFAAFFCFFLEYLENIEEKELLTSERLLEEKLISSIQNAKQSFLDTTIATALAYLLDVLEVIPDTYTGAYPEFLKKTIYNMMMKKNEEICDEKKSEHVYFYRHLMYEYAIREKDSDKKCVLLNDYIDVSDEMRYAQVYNQIKKSVRRLNSSIKTRAISHIQLSQIALETNDANDIDIDLFRAILIGFSASIYKPFNKMDYRLLSFDKSLESLDCIINAFEKFISSYNIDEINNFKMLSKLNYTVLFFLAFLESTTGLIKSVFVESLIEKDAYHQMPSTDFQKKHMHEINKFIKNNKKNNFLGFKIQHLRENLKHYRLDNYSADFVLHRSQKTINLIEALIEKNRKKYYHTNNKVRAHIKDCIINSIPEYIKHESIFEVSNNNKIFNFHVRKKHVSNSMLKPVKSGYCQLNVDLNLHDRSTIFNDQRDIEVMMEEIVKAYDKQLESDDKYRASKQRWEEKKKEELVNRISSLSLSPREPEKNIPLLDICSYEYLISDAAAVHCSSMQNQRSRAKKQNKEELTSHQNDETSKREKIKERNNAAMVEAENYLLNKSSAQEKCYVINTIHSTKPLENPIVIAVKKSLTDDSGATLPGAAQKKINSVTSNIKFISQRSKGQDGIKIIDSNFYLKILNADGQGYRACQNEKTLLPSGATLVVYDNVVIKKHADRKLSLK